MPNSHGRSLTLFPLQLFSSIISFGALCLLLLPRLVNARGEYSHIYLGAKNNETAAEVLFRVTCSDPRVCEGFLRLLGGSQYPVNVIKPFMIYVLDVFCAGDWEMNGLNVIMRGNISAHRPDLEESLCNLLRRALDLLGHTIEGSRQPEDIPEIDIWKIAVPVTVVVVGLCLFSLTLMHCHRQQPLSSLLSSNPLKAALGTMGLFGRRKGNITPDEETASPLDDAKDTVLVLNHKEEPVAPSRHLDNNHGSSTEEANFSPS